MFLIETSVVSELRKPRPHHGVLALDAAICRCWTRLMHKRQDDLLQDAMIAATAQVHGLTVVTRNLRDFQVFDVKLLNPFQAV